MHPWLTFKAVPFSGKDGLSATHSLIFSGSSISLLQNQPFPLNHIFPNSGLFHLKNIFLPFHVSCSYSPLSSSSHRKFSRKLSILAVSICSLPTYSSIHFTLSSTPYRRLKIASVIIRWPFCCWNPRTIFSPHLTCTLAAVKTTVLTCNYLGSQDFTVAWFYSHLPGSSISFASSSFIPMQHARGPTGSEGHPWLFSLSHPHQKHH